MPLFSVYAQNNYAFEFNTKTEPIDNGSIKQTEIGMEFSKNIRNENKFVNTLKYKSTTITDEIESYLLNNYDSNYSNTHFNSLDDTFEYSHQLTDKTKLNISFEPTINFQNTVSINDVTLLGGIEISQLLNKKNSIDVGIKRMTLFGKPQILPTFAFIHQFNKAIALKLGFPNSVVSYSNSNLNLFSLTNEFSGSNYNLNPSILSDRGNSITTVGFSQMETTFQYERNIDTSWFINFKGGYSTNKEFKFSDENRTTEINTNLKNGSIFSISVKYKL
jgi:hypothetical protein